MDKNYYENYSIASISSEDVQAITTLENELSRKTESPVVLIAYQPIAGQSKEEDT
ncbi:hypothetical protein [Clostridium sp. KNHs205]|jgi:hypothetical protein|uniref:hypothetical protein n=1 Tax=Clostridium sp. KNHs205 TaxID=1449050 RepID=UPI000A7A4940|nr:hypothetical protein [Clostridium sp. KNHs205]